jgi:hypothetical protein
MSLTAALLVLLAAPNVEASLAPDQPIPYIFVDDPLVLQLVSNQDTVVSGRVTFVGGDGKSNYVDIPAVTLRAKGTHWQALDGAPVERGRYVTRLALTVGGLPLEQSLLFCRIDRPNAKASVPLGMHLAAGNDRMLAALQGIPARQLFLNADMPDFDARVEEAVKAGCLITVLLDTAGMPDAAARAEVLARSLSDKAAAWAVAAGGNVAAFQAVAEAVRRGGSRAPIVPVVKDEKEVAALFTNGAGRYVNSVVLRCDAPAAAQLDALRSTAAAFGHERFPISVLGTGVDAPGPRAGAELARNVIANLAAGASQCVLEPLLVFSQDQFGEGYVYLTALANRLNGARYIGALDMAGSSHAEVFRAVDRWTIVTWSAENPAQASINAGNATDLAFTDAENNPLPPPEKGNNLLSLWIDREPHYLSGTGGDVIAKAARNKARREAKTFLDAPAFQSALPTELMAIMRTVVNNKTGRTERLNFFALLRLFPVLEQMWREGQLPREVAAPAMASMSEIVCDLCILEQEAGEPFIEVLQATLDRCGEYQSQYLTGSGETNASRERADWLLDEVGRLMTESKQLLEEGRVIEATGVASLAEWRARSLEFAAKAAPLNSPPPAPASTPAPAPAARPG